MKLDRKIWLESFTLQKKNETSQYLKVKFEEKKSMKKKNLIFRATTQYLGKIKKRMYLMSFYH